MEQKKTFEPFERVITKNKESDAVWNCHLFSHYENDCVILVGGLAIDLDYTDIIPFAGNEHLVGTSDMPEEEVELEEGDVIVVFDGMEFLGMFCFQIKRYKELHWSKIRCNDDVCYAFCIPFPNSTPTTWRKRKSTSCALRMVNL